MELDSHQPVFLDCDIQADSCLAMLRESFLELTKQFRARASTNSNDLLAHRSLKRKRTLANYQVTTAIMQLEPKQSISGERRNGTQTASEGSAKMVVIERDWGGQNELPAIICRDPHAHRAGDRYLLVEELLRSMCLRV